jgi:DNA-binding transcriptional LysR family regulator
VPGDLLPRALAELSAAFSETRVDISHASSAAQLAALEAGELDIALVRECPADPGYDAVLAVKEALGILLAASIAVELAGSAGVQLHRLVNLERLGFQHALVAGGKLVAVATGKRSPSPSPGWPVPLPDGVTWCP